jgi:hypothetical protein
LARPLIGELARGRIAVARIARHRAACDREQIRVRVGRRDPDPVVSDHDWWSDTVMRAEHGFRLVRMREGS